MKKIKHIKERLTELNSRVYCYDDYLQDPQWVMYFDNIQRKKRLALHQINVLKLFLKEVRKTEKKPLKTIYAEGMKIADRFPFNKIKEGKLNMYHHVIGFGQGAAPVNIPSLKDRETFIVVHDLNILGGYISSFVEKFGRDPIFAVTPQDPVWFNRVKVY